MPKTISAGLSTHLAGELSTLATLVKVTRRDGVVLGFTSHDRNLVLSGVTYVADGAFSPTVFESAPDLSTDNLEISGLLSAGAITEADLAAGKYDHARVDVYACNWGDLTQGTLQVRRGWLGEVSVQNGRYTAELRGFHDLLQRRIGTVFTPECRHDLGDARCAVALASYTVTGSVTAVTSRSEFTDSARPEADAYFNYGFLTWTSGPNAGVTMEVKNFAADRFTLWLPMPADIGVGNTYSVYAGCDKRFATCRTKFNNAINFGGFPHLPGLDRIVDYPDAKSS